MPQTGQNLLAGVTSWLMGAFGKLFIMNKVQGKTDGTFAPGRVVGGGVINLEAGIAACVRSPRPSLHDLRMKLLSFIAAKFSATNRFRNGLALSFAIESYT